MNIKRCKYTVSQVVFHSGGNYRGMIVDIDPWFMGNQQWYEELLRTNGPIDEPWYTVVVDGADYATYVPEHELSPALHTDPINNPLIRNYRNSDSNQPFDFN